MVELLDLVALARSDRTERSRSRSHASDSYVSAGRPKYSSPVKNLRAAKAAAAELSSLTGEALRKQQGRVQELLDIANKQNIEIKKKNPEAGASGVVHSAKGAADKSAGQARRLAMAENRRTRALTRARASCSSW